MTNKVNVLNIGNKALRFNKAAVPLIDELNKRGCAIPGLCQTALGKEQI